MIGRVSHLSRSLRRAGNRSRSFPKPKAAAAPQVPDTPRGSFMRPGPQLVHPLQNAIG